jgi:very-short-patch-repair endonuclease
MAEMARQQHGVVTREQLLELGMGSHAVGDRVHRGLLQAVHRGVYALGGSRPTVDARRMGAHLGLWPERSAQPSIRGATVGCFPLRAEQDRSERAFHETEVRRLTSRVSLRQLLSRHPGRRGATTVRSILASREPVGITQNEFEELFVAFLDEHGLLRPRLNATLSIRGRFLRPDCMWQEQRLLVELDGRDVHGTNQAFEGDRQRDRVLLAEGWRSTRVTWRQLRDEPTAIAADLREMLHGQGRPPTL